MTDHSRDLAREPRATPADLESLRRELAETRRRRMDAQRRAAERPTVLRAVELTLRDRSAQTSPEVDVLRDRADRLHEELTASLLDVDHIRLLLHRLTTRASHLLPGRTEQLRAALDAERAWRERMNAVTADQGLRPLGIPAAAAAGSPVAPRRPTRPEATQPEPARHTHTAPVSESEPDAGASPAGGGA